MLHFQVFADGEETSHKSDAHTEGKAYRKQMEDETVRLCLSLRLGPEEPVLRSLLSKASAEELTALKNGLEQRFSETYPVRTQLSGNRSKTGVESEYLI